MTPPRGIDIAIIGLAGRFPKAPDVDTLWSNLRQGVEALSRFSLEELVEAGVDPELARDPHYVPAAGRLDGAALFDATFFGYTAREALIMDPQQRHFLECSWEAMENAGYGDPPRDVGVFGGVSVSTYLLNRLVTRPGLLEGFADIETTLGNDKDFLANRVAYKMNLEGPAVVVQSACSSSLVAVHLACTALAASDCEMAIAGGTSIDVPQRAGYLHKPEGIYSSDGHCRPFDARADGMVGGSGAAAVVLKRLDDAIEDRDTIHAVIRGSAVNNDGSAKVGYSAPGVDGQARVIARAQRRAGVEAESIGYVEAHGTGTALGDPIEVTALTEAFATERRRVCALGAVKSNVGHLNAAAGITGLVKATMVVRHGEIPPMIHFDSPNPHLDLDNSPFYVNRELEAWSSPTPRRAGVSSFGMGGTNAHVILEQAPPRSTPDSDGRPRVLPLSARTPTALAAMRERLAVALGDEAPPDLGDVAFTLQTGRKVFPHRTAVVCGSIEEGCEALRSSGPALTGEAGKRRPKVAFQFPGQGSQHPGMARELYATRPVFTEALDRCLECLEEPLAAELRELILAADPASDAGERLARTEVAQPALFVVQYALARLWQSVGVEPSALVGHSIGEYTAACLAGVFGLENALTLVVARGRLMQELPPGAMLAVSLPESEVEPYLDEGLAVAALNDPQTSVISGPFEAIEALESRLAAEDVAVQRLKTSHAFHSTMMQPAAEALSEVVSGIELSAPRVPFASNVTGTWITPENATDPSYWAEHLLRTVRFQEGLGTVLEGAASVLLEVGPGTTLTNLARRHPLGSNAVRAVSTLSHPKSRQDAERAFLEAAASLWTVGVGLTWEELNSHQGAGRVPLPSYPFERQRFWVDAVPVASPVERLDAEQWCYRTSWTSHEPSPQRSGPAEGTGLVVVFDEDGALADGLGETWGPAARVIEVRQADSFRKVAPGRFEIEPWNESHYERVLEAAVDTDGDLLVVHRWADRDAAGDDGCDRGFDSLLLASRAIGRRGLRADWLVVTCAARRVTGNERLAPHQATTFGPCKVIPFEYEGHRCRSLDLEASADGATVVDAVRRECDLSVSETVVAHRDGRRWLPEAKSLDTDAAPSTPGVLRDGVRCLVTGGTRGVGAALAAAIAGACKARIALVARTPLPSRSQWEALAQGDDTDAGTEAVRGVVELESLGCEVRTLALDVADAEALDAAVADLERDWGGLDLIVHAAGVAGGGAIELRSLVQARATMAAKLAGTRHLRQAAPTARMVLCSSLASEIGGYGQIDYCAANAFQDAFAEAAGPGVLAIDWDTWSETGMAVDTEVPPELAAEREESLRLGMTTREAQEVFLRLLDVGESRVMVSTRPLAARLEAARLDAARLDASRADEATDATGSPGTTVEPSAEISVERPDLSTGYDAPRNELEREIAQIWQRLFGVDRVGREDDFFELGGHSLLATQLLNRLRKVAAMPTLSMAELFERPTVALLAELAGGDDSAPSDAEPASLPDLETLAAMPESDLVAWLGDYLAARLPEGTTDGPLDTDSLAPGIVWDLRRDLGLSVYPQELRGAGTVPELSKAISVIVHGGRPQAPPPAETAAGSTAPLSPSRGTEPADRRNESMIFLLSAPRSGSTLMRLMLAGHSELFCPPELALLSAIDMADWKSRQHGMFARDGLTRALMELFDADEETALEMVDEHVSQGDSVQTVYGRLQNRLGSRLLVDKSPAYALDAPTLERAEALFEAPRYILLVRHPASVIDSLVRHRMEVLLAPGPVDDPWRFAESVWRDAYRNLLDLERQLGKRCRRVRYEDLVRDPEPTMRETVAFLGLPYEAALVEPYGGGRMIDGPGDPDIFQHDGIDASLAEAWKSVSLPMDLEDETLSIAAELGYSVAGGEQASDRTSDKGSRTGSRTGGDAASLLDRLDDLSDDEVEATLAALLDDESETR